MTIKIGDRLPAGKLVEAFGFDESAGCPMKPAEVDAAAACEGKRIVIFGVPGAFTPTCSAQHLPGYLANHDAIKARGIDEIWCVAANDGFVMGAWGHGHRAEGKIRMLGDGSAIWTRALGLEFDLTAKGLGMRMQRFSMLVDNGVVKRLNVEAPGEFKVSDAATMLAQLG